MTELSLPARGRRAQRDWGAREINQSLRTKWSNPDCNQISPLNTWIATASPRDDWLSLQTIMRLRSLGIQPPLSFGHLPLSGEKRYLRAIAKRHISKPWENSSYLQKNLLKIRFFTILMLFEIFCPLLRLYSV